jgi:hypothetical protein
MEDHDVSLNFLHLIIVRLIHSRYSEILDYHNVDGSANDAENGGGVVPPL